MNLLQERYTISVTVILILFSLIVIIDIISIIIGCVVIVLVVVGVKKRFGHLNTFTMEEQLYF